MEYMKFHILLKVKTFHLSSSKHTIKKRASVPITSTSFMPIRPIGSGWRPTVPAFVCMMENSIGIGTFLKDKTTSLIPLRKTGMAISGQAHCIKVCFNFQKTDGKTEGSMSQVTTT